MIKNNFFLPVLYLISIISDLLSTFFASPNLEGERAFDAQIFDLKWVGLISFSALYFLCFTTFFIYSRNKLSDKTMISNSYYYFFLVGIIMIIQLTFSGFLASFNNFTIYLLETKKLSGMLYSFLFSYTNLNFNLIQSVGFSVNDIIRLCFFIIMYFNIKKIFPFKRV